MIKGMVRVLQGAGRLSAFGVLMLATACASSVDESQDSEESSVTTEGIIGGSNAVAGGHPWIVRLFNNTSSPAGKCAGTLISASWVLTAAHCVTGSGNAAASPFNIYMYLGDYDTSGFGAPGEGGNWEQGKFASQVIIHPSYSGTNHDIALVKLETPALLNQRVKTIPLNTSNITSGTGIAAGWGATATLNPLDPTKLESTILKRAELTVRSAATCNATELSSNHTLASDEMCAGNANGNPSTCFGDSGGPFIRPVGSGHQLIGVTSWGSHYCTTYVVFSRISSHLNWIRGIVPGV